MNYKALDEALEYLNSGNLPEFIIESNKEMKSLMKKWKVSDQSSIKKEFKNNSLTEDDYTILSALYKIMRTANKYEDYKKAFDKLCTFCHILPKGTIITKCELKKGDGPNNSSIYVQYAFNNNKIKLPDGMKLYHLSRVEGIKELIPVFRGKSDRGYLYDKPRVYFTIHKEMPKFLADYHWYEKMHKYECKADITNIYVDPLVPLGRLQGALYIETNKPVPVEEMGIENKK